MERGTASEAGGPGALQAVLRAPGGCEGSAARLPLRPCPLGSRIGSEDENGQACLTLPMAPGLPQQHCRAGEAEAEPLGRPCLQHPPRLGPSHPSHTRPLLSPEAPVQSPRGSSRKATWLPVHVDGHAAVPNEDGSQGTRPVPQRGRESGDAAGSPARTGVGGQEGARQRLSTLRTLQGEGKRKPGQLRSRQRSKNRWTSWVELLCRPCHRHFV